jgi:hypothetical protein
MRKFCTRSSFPWRIKGKVFRGKRELAFTGTNG